eukprot:Platyproteum_vivax@DN601_c0_g1_i1.p1
MYNQAPNSYNPATPITFGNDPIQQQNPSTQTYSNAQPQQYGQAQQQSAQQPQQYAQQPQPYGQQPQQMNQQPQLIGQQSPQQYVVLNPQCPRPCCAPIPHSTNGSVAAVHRAGPLRGQKNLVCDSRCLLLYWPVCPVHPATLSN